MQEEIAGTLLSVAHDLNKLKEKTNKQINTTCALLSGSLKGLTPSLVMKVVKETQNLSDFQA